MKTVQDRAIVQPSSWKNLQNTSDLKYINRKQPSDRTSSAMSLAMPAIQVQVDLRKASDRLTLISVLQVEHMTLWAISCKNHCFPQLWYYWLLKITEITPSSPLGSSRHGSCLLQLFWCSWPVPCAAPGSRWRAYPAKQSSENECPGGAGGVGHTRRSHRCYQVCVFRSGNDHTQHPHSTDLFSSHHADRLASEYVVDKFRDERTEGRKKWQL